MHGIHSVAAAACFLRIALAAGFLSAVADRCGLWGPAGTAGVVWGNWSAFLDYVALLHWFAPRSIVSLLGWSATIAEALLALGLLVGWRLRLVALASGYLLLLFALMMTLALGIKAPLDYSVIGLAAGSFLLAAISNGREGTSELEPPTP